MGRKNGKNILNYQKKDRVKKTRVIFQMFIIVSLLFLFFRAIFSDTQYNEPDKTQWSEQGGFVALSLPGVSRNKYSGKITKFELNKYFKTLHEAGYITISQDDIIKFYQSTQKLPPKALFLIFESGDINSFQHSFSLLERYNYKATIMTYANKIESKDLFFIQPKEIHHMEESGFWEIGSSGYRLALINVFDQDGNFIPLINLDRGVTNTKMISYNHYLMDFLRDENLIPIESKQEMTKRINLEYQKMEDVYRKHLGSVPMMYMIMHSNSPSYGSHHLVGEVNLANMMSLYKMNFNREGSCFNTKNDSLYDLTRMRINPDWPINHFIMKVNKETNQSIEYVTGDQTKANKWLLLNGVAEFYKNRIVLTSNWNGIGTMLLKESESLSNIRLKTSIPHKTKGKQSMFLRYDMQKNTYISITIEDEILTVEQRKDNSDSEIVFNAVLNQLEMPIDVDLFLVEDNLELFVNNNIVAENISCDTSISSGGILLSASGRNNDISDVIFENLFIESLTSKEDQNQKILFDNRYSLLGRLINRCHETIGFIVNWFIEMI